MEVTRSRYLYGLAVALSVLGAINWGLVGLSRRNMVNKFLGRSKVAERVAYALVGLAGVWLVVASILPRLLLALHVRSEEPLEALSARSLKGGPLPSVTGTTLSGQKITIPRDTLGKVAFLVMGFSYDSRFEVEDWSRAFKERFGQNPGVLFFELPMIGGVYRLFAPAINEGMRRGSPAESYDHVVTVYASQRPLRQAFRAATTSDTWVYLLDVNGRVLFQHSGPFDAQQFQELASLAESALRRVGSLEAAIPQS